MKDRDLILTYRRLDADIARLDDMLNNGDSAPDLFIPRPGARAEAERQLAALKERCAALPAPDGAFDLVKAHMTDFLRKLEANLKDKFTRPAALLRGFMWWYENLSNPDKDSRSESVRAEKAIARLGQSREMFDAVFQWLDTVAPDDLAEALAVCKKLVPTFSCHAQRAAHRFPGLDGRRQAELAQRLQAFADQCKAMQGRLEDLLKTAALPADTDEDSILAVDPQVYADRLYNEHGVVLQELLDWHEEEIEKTRNAVFAIARKLDIPDPKDTMGQINAILLKYAGPADTPEEMLARGRAYIRRTKAAARAYVRLPEEDCRVTTVPEIIKDSYPWGGYGGGCPRRRPLIGNMFLNNYNFKAVTDGWIKMNTVHEAYPGHHVQFVRTTLDPIPETLKRGAKHTPITEGTAHRSEELFEFVFAEDTFYPLFVAYRRHHTAVRIKADLMLRYFGRPIRDVVQLYIDEMDFDRDTARGQVRAQENMFGYFTTYYYGYKKLAQWEREYGIDPKTYTELLFAAGRMSLDNFRRFLDLSAEERRSFLHDFASLIQFDEDYNERPIPMD
ncbi:MAG: DUF885 domain-containing protein [Firmicutes bacterium]|nr:DUF885 domain-containing protein [Bacillota bacterium]HOB35312.1 DUF885 family protein [Bacillota bacterium]HPZ91389.1 DUF885 family protein [Bacillota bacterium]HQE01451.1 DUF885 family protein [Bacillota bacterium]